MIISYICSLVSTLLLSLTVPYSALAFDKDSKIAIIGAGASGLTAAYELREKGYTNVTVFEKELRAGGKVRSIVEGGQVFELGAIWAGDKYPLVDEFAQRYGVTLTPEPSPMTILTKQGQIVGMMDFPLSQHPIWELLQNYVSWLHVQHKYSYLRTPGSYLTSTDPDLNLPFQDFAQKYHIQAFAEGFRPFWVACGYGYYEEVPAIYVLKLMLDGVNLTFGEVLRQALHIGPPVSKPLRIVREGFQEIWVRMAEDLNNVRLGQAVEKVTRRATEDGFVIDVTAGGQTESFERLIISTDPQTASKFLDMESDESSVLSQVHTYRYILHIFEGSPLAQSENILVLPDQNGTKDRQGHVIALLRRSSEPPLWTSLQLYPWDRPLHEATEQLFQNLAEYSISPASIHQRIEWSYFPHVDSAALQAGFYPKAAALQGKKGTYWVGGLWNFETVESTAAFARHLIREKF